MTFTDSARPEQRAARRAAQPHEFYAIVALNGAGANTTAPPLSATVTIPTVMENIAVSDAPTFPDVFDQETITVTDPVKLLFEPDHQVHNAAAANREIRGQLHGCGRRRGEWEPGDL